MRTRNSSYQEDLTAETIGTQFTLVKKETTKSHVMKWGDDELEADHVSDYQVRSIRIEKEGDSVVYESRRGCRLRSFSCP